jgi:hypothetical protein
MIEYNRIQNFNSEKNTSVVSFLSNVLDRRVENKDWDWEFNSFNNTIFHFLSNNGDVVATQSMLPICLLHLGKDFLTYKSESTYILREYRGKKIFENLYENTVLEAFEKGGEIIWGFTPAVNAWKNNFNFSVEEDIILNITVQCGFAKMDSVKRILKNLVVSPLIFLNRIVFSSQSKSITMTEMIEQNQIKSFNEAFLSKFGYCGIDLTKQYQDWRLDSNTFVNYKKIGYYKGEVLIGVAIYSITEQVLNITYMAILDEQYYGEAIGLLYRSARKNQNFLRINYWGNSNNATNKIIFKLLSSKFLSKSSLDPSRSFVYKFKDSNTFESKDLLINALWTEGIRI